MEPLPDPTEQLQPVQPGVLISDKTATSVGSILPASRSNASVLEVA